MPVPLSKDLRERILGAKEEGTSHAKLARELRVSISAITRLLRCIGRREALRRGRGRPGENRG
jgi:transposase